MVIASILSSSLFVFSNTVSICYCINYFTSSNWFSIFCYVTILSSVFVTFLINPFYIRLSILDFCYYFIWIPPITPSKELFYLNKPIPSKLCGVLSSTIIVFFVWAPKIIVCLRLRLFLGGEGGKLSFLFSYLRSSSLSSTLSSSSSSSSISLTKLLFDSLDLLNSKLFSFSAAYLQILSKSLTMISKSMF